MNDPTGEKPEHEPHGKESKPNDSQEAIRRNLNNFLNPGLPLKTPARPPDPNGALQLRMAQMELANKMRLNQGRTNPAAVPMHRSPPPGGFGSAQGVFHMRKGNFGQSRPPNASTGVSKPSPYQQVFANASKPEHDDSEVDSGGEEDILEVPSDAEVKQDLKPKRLKGKRFRNPSLET